AMVVCKRGVKAHPNDSTARLLLARVYTEQGKDRKALEEIQGALQLAPGDPAVHRALGSVHFKLGETDQGGAALMRAADLPPQDPETQALLKKWNITYTPKPLSAPRVLSGPGPGPGAVRPLSGQSGVGQPGVRSSEGPEGPRSTISG